MYENDIGIIYSEIIVADQIKKKKKKKNASSNLHKIARAKFRNILLP